MRERITIDKDAKKILADNEDRVNAIRASFNPITGEGVFLERKKLAIEDFPISIQYVPVAMFWRRVER